MNSVALTAALFGANADMYACSRMLLSLVRGRHAPPGLGRLDAPGPPLLASSIGTPVALIAKHWARGSYG